MKVKSEPKAKGRPRKHQSDADRVKCYRKRKQADGHRIDAYVSTKASLRLTRLADAWECSMGQVIERLLMEADERYKDILFPVTE